MLIVTRADDDDDEAGFREKRPSGKLMLFMFHSSCMNRESYKWSTFIQTSV
jgi:hypothetical protein